MKRLVGLIAFMLSGALVQAEEGRIPIFEPTALDGFSGPISGRYVVTRDITGVGPGLVLNIVGTGTETIELDLNGFSLSGSPEGSVVRVSNVRSFEMRSGTINGGDPGQDSVIIIGAAAADQSALVEDVKFNGGFFSLNIFNVLSNTIRRNRFVSPTNLAVIVEMKSETGPRWTGIVENNVLRDIPVTAMSLGYSANLAIRNNQINAGATILAVGNARSCTITNNNIFGGSTGIRLESSSGCTIKDNTITGLTEEGIILLTSEDVLIQNNVSSDNATFGILLAGSDRCYIDSNTLNDNGTFGLFFDATSDDNAYGGNLALGNAAAPGACPVPGTAVCGAPALCDAGTGNRSFGDNMIPGPPPC